MATTTYVDSGNLRRTTLTANDPDYDECDWCGQKPHRVYMYGNRPYPPYSPRVFCNLDCYRAFNS